MINRLMIPIVALSLVGCSTVGVTKLKEASAKPKDCDIEVFASESDVKRPSETVCIIDAKTGTTIFDDRSMTGALKILKPKACECGADAIIVKSGESGGYNLITGNGQGAATVRAIRFTDK